MIKVAQCWDDGVATDIRLIEILRKYNAKATFNLCPGLIPEKLEPLVRVRLAYPEASLSDLGDLLRPQVSKSTVKYRLNKLRMIAESAGFSPKTE